MQLDVRNTIRELFAESCHEMFTSLGCTISHAALVEEAVSDAPTSVIDAGSDDIELNIILRMPYSVLAMSYPVMGEEINEVEDIKLEDWLSELGNLLMGRVKAKFMRHQCPIMLGLPTSYFGGEIDIFERKDGFIRFDFPFELDHELCECVLDVRIFNEDMVFAIEEDPESDVLAEGEIELF